MKAYSGLNWVFLAIIEPYSAPKAGLQVVFEQKNEKNDEKLGEKWKKMKKKSQKNEKMTEFAKKNEKIKFKN